MGSVECWIYLIAPYNFDELFFTIFKPSLLYVVNFPIGWAVPGCVCMCMCMCVCVCYVSMLVCI